MNKFETINEKQGYKFAQGSDGKTWTRGHWQYKEGLSRRKGEDWKPCIVKTDLSTGDVKKCTVEEHKRFLTKESYDEWLKDEFIKLAERG